ncbi:MAG TPA: dinitrogenase iron-molybdenum cofactor biosynthesis protein [Lentisphaeria bacterium]|nr:MAG: dinitrogenase iron-molybdenum cofactor biosynthesis protein [Lentisphaerae bacterium GWF2_50_93]HCE43977.1 dinitrogenase iron-molybdenum cofactor biosynthesis protein [Lentisphaeria bacterium]
MKIALSTSGYCLGATLESRFGRAPRFIIYDLEKKEFEVLDNNVNMNAAQGAGIQSAMNVIKAGVQAVITGHCGPKAFNLLKNAGIAVYLVESVPLSKAIELLQSNSLKKQESADVDGHWN